jgi:nucleotide-binding universal stress UspA family protein
MDLLLATDGSCYARAAATFLRSHLDPAARVRIHLVAVIPPPGLADDSPAFDRYSEDRGVGPADAHEWLGRTRDELGTALTPASIRILEGTPEDVLVGEARSRDLVVAGVKGCGAAPFFELGRVAGGLLRNLDCSVLLVRNRRPPNRNGKAPSHTREEMPDPADPDGDSPLSVMIPTALGTNGAPTGWPLLQSFGLSRASVEIVTVLDRDLRSNGSGRGAGPRAEGGIGDVRDRTRRWLNRTARRLPVPSGRPRYALLEGRPGAEIERRALEKGTDLIVVGARRGNPSGPGPLGSTARELAWSAPCSILTVRGRERASSSHDPTRTDALALR